MKRKRVYAKPGGTATKKAKTSQVAVPRPRFKAMANPSVPAIKPTFRATLKYFDWFTLNPAAGVAGVYQFSANGLYDPNISGSGHQPTGFDQLMAIYGEYVVIGSTIRVIARSNTDIEPILFGVFTKRSNVTSADFREYVENGNGVYYYCEGMTSGGATIREVKHSCDLSKEAVTNVLTDPDFYGSNTQNPPEQRFYHVVVQPFNFTADIPAQEFCVEITYDVMFRDRINTAVS